MNLQDLLIQDLHNKLSACPGEDWIQPSVKILKNINKKRKSKTLIWILETSFSFKNWKKQKKLLPVQQHQY